MATPGKGLFGWKLFHSSRLRLSRSKSSSTFCMRPRSSIARVEPASWPSTSTWLPLTATMGASMTSSTFSACGSLMFLSTPISPDAEKVIRRKMTVTRRKSMYEVRLRPALMSRAPWPVTLRHTKWSGMFVRSRLPGVWMVWACGSLCACLRSAPTDMMFLPSAHRERHVEDGEGLDLALTHVDLALAVVQGVEHAHDVAECEPVFHVQDGLVELLVALVLVTAVDLPLLAQLLGEVFVLDDVAALRWRLHQDRKSTR